MTQVEPEMTYFALSPLLEAHPKHVICNPGDEPRILAAVERLNAPPVRLHPAPQCPRGTAFVFDNHLNPALTAAPKSNPTPGETDARPTLWSRLQHAAARFTLRRPGRL